MPARPAGRGRLLLRVGAGGLALGLLLGLGAYCALPAAPDAPPVPEPDEAQLRQLAHDPARIAQGRALWGNCVGCHGLSGQGATGPNLRDDYWLHGSDMRDICRSIADGYPLKGMPSWGAAGISADNLHALAAYVASLHGSEDGTGKAPEGVLAPIAY